jgi:PST family polysaccharide transporter
MEVESNSADLANRTVQGVSWSGLSQAITQGFTWIISIVLARLLGPSAYGLIGMVGVFTSFAILFGGLGFGVAIVQRKNLEERHLSTAFWMNLATGALITLLMVGFAPVIARFYHEPLLVPITRIIALRFLFDSLDVVQSALLRRQMRFRALGAIQIGSGILSGIVALAMALGGMGIWSLVALTLGLAFFPLPLLWYCTRWRPSLSFDWAAGRELFGFSAPLVGLDVLTYWARSLDTLLIGRFLGAWALGIYSRAFSLMLMPLTQVSSVVGNVMIPALSSIQEDKPRVKRSYLKAVRLVGLITFPMMVGIFVTADHLILALLGPKWAEVVPILRIMCWVGLLQSIGRWDWICISQGATGLYFKIGVTAATAYAAAFIVGLRWGITGMATAYLICHLAICYPTWAAAGRIINLSFQAMVRTVSPLLVCALSMGVIVFTLRRLLPPALPIWGHLAAEIMAGVSVYFSLLIGFRLKAWEEGRLALAEMVDGKLEALKDVLSRPRPAALRRVAGKTL